MTGNTVLDQVLADLAAQGDELDGHVAGLSDDQWRTPTPAEGWDIATQVAHLAWTDRASIAAVAHVHGDTEGWDNLVLEAIADPEHVVDKAALAGADRPAADLLADWRQGRAQVIEALRSVPRGHKIPWYGPPMSPTSMATARFMETWAHSLDVYDALGVTVAPTDRIVHVAHIGVRTRNFAFVTNGLEPPTDEFRISLTSPSGEQWEFGPDDAVQTVNGSAYDFCLLATQRVHRADTDLVAVGAEADQWLDIAQCFAGNPGAGREAK
ncbi:TIGR03084 family metal-binding protein [Nocardioides sp. AE5]|uniref:TIGR03084 family metal-binding protein n=1 Tax=Nocardioides sp. AE5 TaxID=2962573 RepID=UPI002880CD9C|nr:TIGR03084 family metal-binding protein [Nocardioides sp. AE5]MDT0200421.1 TIGR03084 family metal-binding protein [Nocardioides sp. AE5]